MAIHFLAKAKRENCQYCVSETVWGDGVAQLVERWTQELKDEQEHKKKQIPNQKLSADSAQPLCVYACTRMLTYAR